MQEQNKQKALWFAIGFTVGATIMTIVSIISVLTIDLCL